MDESVSEQELWKMNEAKQNYYILFFSNILEKKMKILWFKIMFFFEFFFF